MQLVFIALGIIFLYYIFRSITISKGSISQLIKAIDYAILILNKNGLLFWADKLQNASKMLLSTSLRPLGLYRLKRYFGGMGSLNDLILGNDDNERLKKALDEIFDKIVLIRASENEKLQYEEFKNQNKYHPRIFNAFR